MNERRHSPLVVSGALGTVAFAGMEASLLLCMFLFARHIRLVIPLTQETLPCLEVSSPSVTLYFPKPQSHKTRAVSTLRSAEMGCVHCLTTTCCKPREGGPEFRVCSAFQSQLSRKGKSRTSVLARWPVASLFLFSS